MRRVARKNIGLDGVGEENPGEDRAGGARKGMGEGLHWSTEAVVLPLIFSHNFYS